MEYSKHNIFGPIKDSGDYYLINPLYQQADILDSALAERYKSGQVLTDQEFIDKKYVVDLDAEEKEYRQKYLDFVDDRDTDEVQIFFAPWYDCNFKCSYCFQDEYTNPNVYCADEVIDAFFEYVHTQFAGRNKYLTLFGGEPLMPNEKAKHTVEYFLNKANEAKLDVAVVTNGYALPEYIDILKKGSIREVQVTVDGAEQKHNERRKHKSGKGSFTNIVEGINLLLENNLPVNLRMVVDKENVEDLPALSQYAIDAGWTASGLFKTQLGRNYELHHCQEESHRLFTRLNMYERIFDLMKEHPHIAEFHKPAFSISKFLFENGELPVPLFDSCPGTKTEWAFDYTGSVYSCTATVGKAGEELGKFYPQIERYDDIIEDWEDRDVLSIEKCSGCNLRLACGGGCAAVAKVQKGSVADADCRPVDGLLSLGIAHYFE